MNTIAMATMMNENADIMAFNAIYSEQCLVTPSFYFQKHFLAVQ
jgi:hypothetical protein